MFEFKWRKKRVGERELDKFVSKMNADHYVYITNSGYTEAAIEASAAHSSLKLIKIMGDLSCGEMVVTL